LQTQTEGCFEEQKKLKSRSDSGNRNDKSHKATCKDYIADSDDEARKFF